MAKTLAQKAADKQLDDAVQRMIEAYKLLPEGCRLVDYVVAIEGLQFDEEGEVSGEGFGLGFRQGNCRTAVAIGVLTKGLEMLRLPNDMDVEDVG